MREFFCGPTRDFTVAGAVWEAAGDRMLHWIHLQLRAFSNEAGSGDVHRGCPGVFTHGRG